MHLINRLICLTIFFSVPRVCLADSDIIDSFSTYRLTIGVSFHQMSFEVASGKNSETYGILSEDISLSPIVTLGSPYKFFPNSHWGGFMEYSFSTFHLTQQGLDGETENLVDLGTSVDGAYAFATGNLVYSFFGKKDYLDGRHALLAGMGLGLGLLHANGDIIFTETTQERFDIDITSPAIALTMILDYRIGHITSRISAGTVYVVEGDYENEPVYEYSATRVSWSIGYLFGL